MKQVLFIRSKLVSINDHPDHIVKGYALGIFLATTPFIGLKVFIALIVCSLLKWNKIAAVIGVYHVNPLTAPVFYAISFWVGREVTGIELSFSFPESVNLESVLDIFMGSLDSFGIFMTGSLILGIPLAFTAKEIVKRFIMNTTETNSTAEQQTFALVTGASRGLGKSIAFELAERKYNLLLVSLKGEGLACLSGEISDRYHIKVKYFEADLSKSNAVHEVAAWAKKSGPVSILVNNAGKGGTKLFDKASPDYLDAIIQLNIRATTLLTSFMLPELKRQKQAYILNVASMASFSPVAYKTVYPASKTFIWSLSRGLNQELKDTSVSVSVIHPGPMKTNRDVTKRINRQGFFGRIGLLTTDKMARIAVNGLLNRRGLIIPGLINKMNWMMIQVVPVWVVLTLLSTVIKRELRSEKMACRIRRKSLNLIS